VDDGRLRRQPRVGGVMKESAMPRKRRSQPGPYLVEARLERDESFDPGRFPHCLPAIRFLETLAFHPRVTFFVGENGTGKSTLLEAIAVACRLNPEGGSRNFNFATRASHADLDRNFRLARAPAQSHGESFSTLFRNRFRDHGLYLMDEPEAALSPRRQLEFLSLMHDYVQRGGQFVIATHSPIIMAYPDAVIYNFSERGIEPTPYTDTEHYLVTRGFLSNPQRHMEVLFGEAEGGAA
jgi:predicted ATPase